MLLSSKFWKDWKILKQTVSYLSLVSAPGSIAFIDSYFIQVRLHQTILDQQCLRIFLANLEPEKRKHLEWAGFEPRSSCFALTRGPLPYELQYE